MALGTDNGVTKESLGDGPLDFTGMFEVHETFKWIGSFLLTTVHLACAGPEDAPTQERREEQI